MPKLTTLSPIKEIPKTPGKTIDAKHLIVPNPTTSLLHTANWLAPAAPDGYDLTGALVVHYLRPRHQRERGMTS
ncbi:MAG: hypothetical protein ACKV0T_21395 [Planctomycetales bacterium]